MANIILHKTTNMNYGNFKTFLFHLSEFRTLMFGRRVVRVEITLKSDRLNDVIRGISDRHLKFSKK
jgi:hypothetical protein